MGRNWVSLSALAALLAVSSSADAAMTTSQSLGKTGTHYRFFHQNNLEAQWVVKRPDKSDKKIALCIPAAFTDKDGRIGGVHAVDGTFFNMDQPDKSIGGVLALVRGKCLMKTAPAGNLPPELVHLIKASKGDLFQQFLVVVDGAGEKFKDSSRFQRRGIARLKDGTVAMVESDEDITLTAFGEDMAGLGVQDLVYTDMGWWDEGWYRSKPDAKPTKLGKSRVATSKQTNWLLFREITK
jgi:hypothetical protein